MQHSMCLFKNGTKATPQALNLSLSGIVVDPHVFDSYKDGSYKDDFPQWQDYDCIDGIVTQSPDRYTLMSDMALYRARAKATIKTSLFVSMREQSYDDVYAVYTGVLGALFGAFALLVTTLFVYLVAALKRTLTPAPAFALLVTTLFVYLVAALKRTLTPAPAPP